MTAAGVSHVAHDDVVDRIRLALQSAPARPRVTLPQPPRDERGRYAAAKAADTPERDG